MNPFYERIQVHFQRLTSGDDGLFEKAFDLYTVSFPEHEQRFRANQCALMANTDYHFDAIMDGDSFAGIILYWEFPGYAYIEHFAIHPELRGRAFGSESLRLFGGGRDLVVLEIDPPDDPVSVRREAFYHKLGFRTNPFSHTHPRYRESFPPHRLVVLSSPRELTEKEYARFAEDLSGIVMADAQV